MKKSSPTIRIRWISGFAILLLNCQMSYGQLPVAGAQMLTSGEPVQSDSETSAKATGVPTIREVRLSEQGRAWQINSILLGYHPSAEDLQAIQKVGFQRVVNLQAKTEGVSADADVCKQLGLEYRRIPVNPADGLTQNLINQVRIVLLDSGKRPVYLHADSKDLVAAIWIAYRSLDQGVELEKAIEEARSMGLANSEYEQKVRDYIRQMQYTNAPINQEYDFAPPTLPGSS